jgi:ribosomal protein L3 glutamine methyltransferase
MTSNESINPQFVNLRELIMWGEQQLLSHPVYFGHGTDNALDEAAWLISHAIGLPVDFSDDALDKPVGEQQKNAALESIRQRIESRLPAAYLTHEAWFAGYSFYVDERTLVPRSPLAELILDDFQPWIDAEGIEQVLDLCTGSGCIGISIALTLPNVHVDCSDVSQDALDVARINVKRHTLEERINVIESDLFAKLDDRSYDLIISNPPYVDAEDMAALPEEYTHEPRLGLAAGENGLTLVVPMLKQAAKHLNPGGVIIVEVGNSESALAEMYPQLPFTWLEFEYGGHGVFLLAKEDLEAADL